MRGMDIGRGHIEAHRRAFQAAEDRRAMQENSERIMELFLGRCTVLRDDSGLHFTPPTRWVRG